MRVNKLLSQSKTYKYEVEGKSYAEIKELLYDIFAENTRFMCANDVEYCGAYEDVIRAYLDKKPKLENLSSIELRVFISKSEPAAIVEVDLFFKEAENYRLQVKYNLNIYVDYFKCWILQPGGGDYILTLLFLL